MKSPFITIALLLSSIFLVNAQFVMEMPVTEPNLDFYLPEIQYNNSIPTPESFLGFQIGKWHVSHDQLKYYMETIAEASDRIKIEEYATSHEGRSLQLLTISSPKNLKNLESIRQEHLKLTDPKKSKKLNLEEMPLVLYQGYSIHGNESSGSNAAMLVAYYLAAGESEKLDSLLNHTIILLDPCYNPDGLQRFSSWVNRYKAETLNSDPNDIEFNEMWPGGRTNHYWFDLNRDWLLLSHPESAGRIRNFHKWKPNILTDHHEMGKNTTFFFQPGVPKRTNPNTPIDNQSLTEKIGQFHAKALDEIGSLYYSKENFDDYYYGKGSTYPDINGGIGILFEQASSRGHIQETENGLLSFPFTIKNQITTSLSTQEASLHLRKELLEYQRNFYTEAQHMGAGSKIKAYKISCQEDQLRLERFAQILDQHAIKLYSDPEDRSLYILTDQSQYRLLKAIMERVNSFRDSVFYDVSAWTLPDAFNLRVKEIEQVNFKLPKSCQPYQKNNLIKTAVIGEKATYAYIFEWKTYYSSRALQMLLDKGLKTKITHSDMHFRIGQNDRSFKKGSIIITVKNQSLDADKIYNEMQSISQHCSIDIYALNSGYSENGISLGSPKIKALKNKSVAMIIGDGTNAYDAGEIWYHFDQQLEKPLTKIDKAKISALDLSRYDVIILPDGNYGSVNGRSAEKIKSWIKNGGNLICFKSAIMWAQQNGLSSSTFKLSVNTIPSKDPSYELRSEDRNIHLVGGAIVQVELDLSHPLSYGYSDPKLSVFQKGNRFLAAPKNLYAAPLNYSKKGLISGYMSSKNIENMADTPAILVHAHGKGRVICFNFNPLFRAYFWGSNKLFENALYFGHLIDAETTE